jgi:hypothetical protein
MFHVRGFSCNYEESVSRKDAKNAKKRKGRQGNSGSLRGLRIERAWNVEL